MNDFRVLFKAWRYAHGKIVTMDGGPVPPGFGHCDTSVSKGLPEVLLGTCYPHGVLKDRSIQEIISPRREREGAWFFRPAACDRRRYMLATCLRARPESGEGGLSRTYTQVVTFVFNEDIWIEQAPRLIANIPHWLRAEPDTVEFHERHREDGGYPSFEFTDARLPDQRDYEGGALPASGDPLWRFTAALDSDSAHGNLICGAADRIDSYEFFACVLARAAALIPRPLRIYLTAAAGFAEPQGPFAIQYCPECTLTPGAPGLLGRPVGWVERSETHPPSRAAGSEPPNAGLLEQIAIRALPSLPMQDRRGWLDAWESDVGLPGEELHDLLDQLVERANWSTPEGARAHIWKVFDAAIEGRSVKALSDWLDGTRDTPPKRPDHHLEKTGSGWIKTLVKRIDDATARPPSPPRAASPPGESQSRGASVGWVERSETHPAPARGGAERLLEDSIEGKPKTGVARALLTIATLIDTDETVATEEQARQQVRFWQTAWRDAAAAKSGGARDVLRWSVLCASPRIDEPPDLGRLRDFGELRAIVQAIQHARRESPQDAAGINRLFTERAVIARIDDLRRRAGRLLVLRPLEFIEIEAALPSLLAPRTTDDSRMAADLEETLKAALIACRLPVWAKEKDPPRPWQWDLTRAVRLVVTRSFGVEPNDDALHADFVADPDRWLKTLLRRHWQWTVADNGEVDRTCTLWFDGINQALAECVRKGGAPAAVRALNSGLQPEIVASKAGADASARLAAAVERQVPAWLDRIEHRAANPAETAIGLLELFGDLDALVVVADPPGPSERLREAAYQRIIWLLNRQRPAPDLLVRHFLPRFGLRLGERLGQDRPVPSLQLVERVLNLAAALCGCLLDAGAALPRERITELFESLEHLVHWHLGKSAPSPILETRIGQVASVLARCILQWAEATPPEPWFDTRWFREAAPGEGEWIRRTLAARLGYPQSAYFAALSGGSASISSESKTTLATGEDYEIRTLDRLGILAIQPRAVDKVVAYGAVTLWRTLFFSDKKPYREAWVGLMQQPATVEVLGALVRLLSDDATLDYRRLIDDETWFAIGFLAGLDRDDSPFGPPRIGIRLRNALIEDDWDRQAQYALALARQIVMGPSILGGNVTRLFEHRESNSRLARRVLLLPGGWKEFGQQDEKLRRHGLLRLLFLLGLIRQADGQTEPRSPRVAIGRDEIERAFRLPQRSSGIGDAMAEFFDRNPDFREAFHVALNDTGIKQLLNWPDLM